MAWQWKICSACQIVYSLFLFLARVLADCGSDKVFSLPITNVSLSNSAAVRGIPISVGTPPQTLAFLPQWPLNDTWIYDQQGQCPASISSTACITYRGGLYNNSTSKTYSAANAESLSDSSQVSQAIWATDQLALGPNVTLPEFGFGIPRTNFGSTGHLENAFGLGSGSSILSALRSAGRIPSRTWSMYWGVASGTSPPQMDGTFVFGGYDNAKVQGQHFTQAMVPPTLACSTGMVLQISDLMINLPDGSTPSLFSSQAAEIAVCLVPDWPMITGLPYNPYYRNFESLTGTTNTGHSTGLNFGAMLYAKGTAYGGDLAMKFSNGLSVKIPNGQLVVPNDYLANNDGLEMNNYTNSEVLINSLQGDNSEDMPIMGRHFLSAAYLMVNLDTNEFTLWAATPNATQDLVAVGASCPASPPVSNTTAVTLPTATGQSKYIATPSATLGAGAIAGISIAGIVVIIFGAIILWVVRRRRQQGKQPLSIGHGNIAEAPSNEVPFRELDGWSKPSEVSAAHAIWAASYMKGMYTTTVPGTHEMDVPNIPQELDASYVRR